MLKLILISTLSLGLCSCNLSPPTPILRGAPVEALDTAKQEALEEAAFITDGWLSQEWWHLFNDPQLNDLIERALEQNPSMDAVEARIGSALAMRDKAYAPLYPTLEFEADTLRVHESPNSVFGILHASNPAYPITYRQNDMSLAFAYRFDFMRKYYNQIAASLDEVQAMSAEAYTVKLSLSLSVAKSYFQWQVDQNRLLFANEIVEKRKKLVELLNQKQVRGLNDKNSLNRVENSLLNGKQLIDSIAYDSLISKNELESLIAENFTTPLAEVKINSLFRFPLPETLELDLLAHRPDVWAHRWRVEAAGREIAAARADFYPNVDLKGFIGLQALSYRPFLSWDSVAGLLFGPAIHLPIFDGGLIRSNYDYRWQQYYLAVADYDKSVLNATKEVLNSLANLQWADQNYQQALELEKIAKSNMELSRLQLKQKLISRVDLITFEDQFLQARDSSLLALQNSLEARLDLINALGGGFGICDIDHLKDDQ